MTQKQRWLLLVSLLLATLLAGYLADDEPAEAGAKGGERAGATTQTPPAEQLAAMPLDFPEPRTATPVDENPEGADPFRNKSWFVAPPAPPPPKPTAPPLPFQYLGKLDEDGSVRVFLGHQGKHIIAKLGDVINGTYNVEEIAGGQMVFRYIPLNERQTLSIGSDK